MDSCSHCTTLWYKCQVASVDITNKFHASTALLLRDTFCGLCSIRSGFLCVCVCVLSCVCVPFPFSLFSLRFILILCFLARVQLASFPAWGLPHLFLVREFYSPVASGCKPARDAWCRGPSPNGTVVFLPEVLPRMGKVLGSPRVQPRMGRWVRWECQLLGPLG